MVVSRCGVAEADEADPNPIESYLTTLAPNDDLRRDAVRMPQRDLVYKSGGSWTVIRSCEDLRSDEFCKPDQQLRTPISLSHHYS